MPADLITSDDLDALGFASFDADDPIGVDAAVDEGRLADVADTAYGLSLAAENPERQGDLDRAVALAGRAAEASHARGDDYGHPRALYDELLIRSGREDEGLAVLGALRPLLTAARTRSTTSTHALAAIVLNAHANDVAVDVSRGDLLDGDRGDAEVVLVGDVFYSQHHGRADVAVPAPRCLARARVLVGDPGRACLPTTGQPGGRGGLPGVHVPGAPRTRRSARSTYMSCVADRTGVGASHKMISRAASSPVRSMSHHCPAPGESTRLPPGSLLE